MEENKKPMSRTKKILLWALVVCLMLLSFGGGYLTYYLSLSKSQKTVNWVIEMIDRHYLVYDEDTGEVRKFTSEDYAAAISILLDPYSGYYGREAYADMISTNMGNHYGVGVSFLSREELKIFAVSGNSPAERAGIKKGGVITAVEFNEKIPVVTFEEFSEVLNAVPAETNFKMHIKYGEEEKCYVLAKESYVESYVSYRDSGTGYNFLSTDGGTPTGREVPENKNAALAADTAYIEYTSFMYNSDVQLGEALDFMASRGRTKLIIDLRDNGGGAMDVLQKVAEYFIDNGGKNKNLVALAKYKNGKEDKFYTSENRFKDIKVAVLANDNTASASECLIGAMISYGSISYDTLVITENDGVARTYGKGIMQTTFPHVTVWDAIKLTTAYIYWPDGETNIHGKGIFTTPENSIVPSGNLAEDYELNRAAEILKNL